MIDFHSISLDELQAWMAAQKAPSFRASQLFQWVYQKGVVNWEDMTDLPKTLRASLSMHWRLMLLKKVRLLHSKDEETVKFLWELEDGKLVESVLIYSKERRTVCVSSQVGCPARCAFCASGKKGLIRQLSPAEIFEQVYQIDLWLKSQGERVSHVVFMGMGEPLENYENVMRAIQLLCDEKRLHLSQRRITVSTVGIVEGIQRMSKEGLKVNLVLSLHAPNQRIRQKIIPYARRYPLEDILSAMLEYSKETKRDVTYEYTLISGINDKKEHAQELVRLLKGHPCTINLIPYNPVPGLHLQRPEKQTIEEFRALLDAAKIPTTWRYTKGKDIAAACGQLALQESIIK